MADATTESVMSVRRRGLCAFYVLVAVIALVATWSQNVAYFKRGDGAAALWAFVLDTKANPASRSITVDIGLFLLAAAVFMVIEARRLGVRFVWLYILLGFLIAISVTFPLFMVARELRSPSTGSTAGTSASWQLTRSDLIGLAMVAAAVLGLGWFVSS